MTTWRDLDAALDAWRAEDRVAEFWWRDDDAHVACPALDRLLSIADAAHSPLALAVVPTRTDRAMVAAVDGTPVAVLQHGYSHRNLAPPSEKRSELGLHRPTPYLLAELATGRQHLTDLFGPRVLPVLVPPWNRIAVSIVPMLPEIGYRGLSRFTPRKRPEPVSGLKEVNAHVDIVDWKRPPASGRSGDLTGPRPFVGETAALGQIVAHLEARRLGRADPAEPTGLLTHHLVHGDDAWSFVDRLVGYLADHPAARWCDPAALFAA
jgi:peptidoglycan/xylan/chitin deacetylase (PgdA/CDA1 family)